MICSLSPFDNIVNGEMVAVYVGCGSDTRPIQDLPHIRTFHYVDTERTNFDVLDAAMKSAGLSLVSHSEDIRTYKNEIQTVNLYTCADDLARWTPYIQGFDTLVVSSHNPHSQIMDGTHRLVKWVGFSVSPFGEYTAPESTMHRLNNDKWFRAKFRSFDMVWKGGVKRTFPTWDDLTASVAKHMN